MKISIKNVFVDLFEKMSRTKMDELDSTWKEMDGRTKEKIFRQVNIDPNKTLGYETMSLKQMPMNIANKITAWICSEFYGPGHSFYRHEPRIKRSFLTVDQAYEKAQVLQRGRILSQESYKIISNQLKETDLYPFTTKLVSVGIRVAVNHKTTSKCLFNRFYKRVALHTDGERQWSINGHIGRAHLLRKAGVSEEFSVSDWGSLPDEIKNAINVYVRSKQG